MEHGYALGLPVMLVAIEHEERCLHTSTERGTDVWGKLTALPEPVGQQAGPEEFVVAATFGALLDGGGREITLETCTEVVGEVQFSTSSDTKRRAADIQTKRIVSTILVATMHHHTAREALDKLVLLGRCPHYPTGR